jgi:hypothetical protein
MADRSGDDAASPDRGNGHDSLPTRHGEADAPDATPQGDGADVPDAISVDADDPVSGAAFFVGLELSIAGLELSVSFDPSDIAHHDDEADDVTLIAGGDGATPPAREDAQDVASLADLDTGLLDIARPGGSFGW